MECFGRSQKEVYCSIRLLDETELALKVQRNTRGGELLDQVFDKLNLLEKDYFGLRYLDSQDQTHWLDPVKTIGKQIKNGLPFVLYFGVKFYMENPCKLKEEVTRYQFFLQLRMDMLQGRLPCSFHAAAELCAYATQSELGDYDASRHSKGYISEFRFTPNQTEELEEQITQQHQKLKGMAPSKAELSFLERARWLDMYGVDLHPVLGDNDVEFYLGLTPTGVVVYKNKTKVARYFWPRISKVHFKDTEFTLVVLDKDGLEDECIFRLSSKSACKHLWKCSVEQHAFFRLPQVGDEPLHQRKLSFTKSSFRHTGRTQLEALEAASSLNRPVQQVNRAPSRKYHRRPSQTDVSLKNGTTPDDEFLDDGPASPNGVLLRLSPQPASRLPSHHRQSGRDSPTSGMSTRSVPWEDSQQARVGLFTPAGGSPVSVRSSASRQHRHRGRSKSPAPHHRHGDRSDSESEAAYSAKRRGRRSVDSDAGSDNESRHHRQHRKRRSRSRGVSSGSESEYSRHDEGRRHRRRSRERMVSSQDQWNAVKENKLVRGEMREGQEVIVKRLKDGYPDSESSSLYHLNRNHHHHHNHQHHHSPRQGFVNNRTDAEFQKHIKKDLLDPRQYTEEERHSIPYTNVVLDSGTVDSSRPKQDTHTRTRSRKNEDFSDSNVSEHSTRHRSRNASPKSHRHIRKSHVPEGTPPPPYSPNGASRLGNPAHTPMGTDGNPPLESRGGVGSREAAVIQNGDVKGSSYSGYLQSGGGMFGRQQPKRNQEPLLTNAHQGHDRHPRGDPSPTLGMEGLRVAHSREDSGLGNEHEEGFRQTLPRQEGQPRTTVRTQRREVDVHRSCTDPMTSGEVTDLRTTLHLTPGYPIQAGPSLVSYPDGTRPDEQPRMATRSYDAARLQSGNHRETNHVPVQAVHNGGPNYPTKLRPAPTAYSHPNGDTVSQFNPNQTAIPNWSAVHKRDPVIINNNHIDVANEKGVVHLWSKPIAPNHAVVMSSLVDDRDMRVNGEKAGSQGDTVPEELPDFPPGYKPNYSRGGKRYSITTQEMIRVSTLDGDNRDLQTEL